MSWRVLAGNNSWLNLVTVALLSMSCTPHQPSGEASEPAFLRDARAGIEMMFDEAAEERRTFEDRSRVREAQRARGLRICEEGENGTLWQEDCNSCRCEDGMRSCTRIMCKRRTGDPTKDPKSSGSTTTDRRRNGR